MRRTDRKTFLQTMGALAAGVSAGQSAFAAPETRARVVVIRDPGALDPKNRPRPEALRAMIDRGLCRLSDRENAKAAWLDFVSPTDTIGLKVNCLGGPRLCTHPALAEAVADSLEAAGIPARQIIVWDRTDRELVHCGYSLTKTGGGRRCLGTPAFEKDTVEAGGIATRLSSLITSDVTAMINVPVLKTHSLAGFSGSLKNEMGCIDNPREFHPNHCRAAGDVSALEAIRSRRRLVICDALRPLYDQGPMDMPSRRWNECALILATDPVAADLVGRAILEEKRKGVRGGQPWPLSPPATHLERAIELGLGVAGLDNVEQVVV